MTSSPVCARTARSSGAEYVDGETHVWAELGGDLRYLTASRGSSLTEVGILVQGLETLVEVATEDGAVATGVAMSAMPRPRRP